MQEKKKEDLYRVCEGLGKGEECRKIVNDLKDGKISDNEFIDKMTESVREGVKESIKETETKEEKSEPRLTPAEEGERAAKREAEENKFDRKVHDEVDDGDEHQETKEEEEEEQKDANSQQEKEELDEHEAIKQNIMDHAENIGAFVHPRRDLDEWVKNNGNKCICDPDNRTCPCEQSISEVKNGRSYDGQKCCKCTLIVSKEYLERQGYEFVNGKWVGGPK